MTRSILHIGAWGRNWGDHAIRYCMVRDLTEAFNEKNIEPDWHYADIQETDFDGFDFSPYDLVIVGGGGLLWDKPELRSYTGWQWRIPADQLLDIECPIVVYGIGYTKFPYHDPTGSEAMWSHLRVLNARADLFSVRNTETRNLLKQHGIGRVSHIPDPAVALGRTSPPQSRNGRRTVGLCWASDKPMWRFRSEALYDHWLDSFARYLARVTLDTDRVLMVEHIRDMDSKARAVFREHLGDRFQSLEESGGVPVPETDRVPQFFSVYDACDLVISARKHGVWIPAGKRVPVMGFGSLAEVSWTCASVGMGQFHVEPVDIELWPEWTRQKLQHAFEAAGAYDRLMAPLESALKKFNAKVAGLVA